MALTGCKRVRSQGHGLGALEWTGRRALFWEAKVFFAPYPARGPADNGPETQNRAVTPVDPNPKTGEGIIQQVADGRNTLQAMPIEVRISELAGQGISTRKIAAALESEGYQAFSHLGVARTLRREAQLPPNTQVPEDRNPGRASE